MKKVLSISERVDLLLKEGVDNPKKWAAIHGYEEPDENIVIYIGDYWGAEWQKLRQHHLEETQFLFDVIRELTKRISK